MTHILPFISTPMASGVAIFGNVLLANYFIQFVLSGHIG